MQKALQDAVEKIMKSKSNEDDNVQPLTEEMDKMNFYVSHPPQNNYVDKRRDDIGSFRSDPNRFQNISEKNSYQIMTDKINPQSINDQNRFQNIKDHNNFQNNNEQNRFQGIAEQNRFQNNDQNRFQNNNDQNRFQNNDQSRFQNNDQNRFQNNDVQSRFQNTDQNRFQNTDQNRFQNTDQNRFQNISDHNRFQSNDHNRFQNIPDYNRFQHNDQNKPQNAADVNRFQNIPDMNKFQHNNEYPRQYQKYNFPNYNNSYQSSNPLYYNNSYQTTHDNDGETHDYQRDRRESNNAGHAMSVLYKTKLCTKFLTSGQCIYGTSCTFAHGKAELRVKSVYNNDMMRPNSNFYPNNKSNLRVNNPPSKDLMPGYYPPPSDQQQQHPFGSKALLENSEEPTPDQKFDFSRLIAPMYRNLDQRPKITPTVPMLAPPFFRNPENTTSVPQTGTQPAEEGSKPSNLTEEQDVSLSQQSKKKVQEVKSIPLKELLKDPGVEKVTPTQIKKPLIDEKLIAEFRQITENPDISANDELRELTRMEFRCNLSKLQIFTLLIESLFPECYDKKKLSDRVVLFTKFIVSPSDQEILLKALENTLPKAEPLLNSAVFIFKDLYDAELIEEDEYVKWNFNCKNETFKAKVKPFIDWLCTAEEEE